MTEETPYERYLHADKILSFQKKEEELVVDGERDFQGVQQEAEFIWNRIIPMLRRANDRMKSENIPEATHLLEQAAHLWSGLTEKNEELLWRLWPGDFLKIREVLGPGGSTADSPRYHTCEKIARGLWEPYEEILKKRSVSLNLLLGGDVDQSDLKFLTKAMMIYDYRVQEFNLAHLYLVFGEIGDRTVGLKGGTTDYLIRRYGNYLFPKLWDTINELYHKPD
jgi:tryptophan 2,3-dioxygenase